MSCCEPAKWKREEISDHKFDYIDVDDFVENSWLRKLQYSFVFLGTLKSVLVYIADITLLALLFSSNIFTGDGKCNSAGTPTIGAPGIFCESANSTGSTLAEQVLPFGVRKWMILVTILISFILLALDWRKANAIIKSRDISYAFTSPIAYRYYVLRSYPHYCFFSQIQNSRKTVDVLAFFVFFQFKGWKRLLLAEFPRQLLNALTLADLINKTTEKDEALQNETNIFVKYWTVIRRLVQNENTQSLIAYGLSTFTVVVWSFSFIGLLAAFFVYIPLLCNIRGNLKEYCCHKIDKRIGELLRRKSRKRTEAARRAELAEIERNQKAGKEYNNTGDGFKAPPPLGLTQRPTLPDIEVDLDAPLNSKRMNGGVPQPWTSNHYANSEHGSQYNDNGSEFGGDSASTYYEYTPSSTGYNTMQSQQSLPPPPGSMYNYGAPMPPPPHLGRMPPQLNGMMMPGGAGPLPMNGGQYVPLPSPQYGSPNTPNGRPLYGVAGPMPNLPAPSTAGSVSGYGSNPPSRTTSPAPMGNSTPLGSGPLGPQGPSSGGTGFYNQSRPMQPMDWSDRRMQYAPNTHTTTSNNQNSSGPRGSVVGSSAGGYAASEAGSEVSDWSRHGSERGYGNPPSSRGGAGQGRYQ
ncbi:hypothetical protein HDV05_007486 [Chytridiales sp. JEL 0842]|nr:hypothetical protein HDV05_007486 [Chytridiales sp. JEL 0842]